MPPKNLQKTAKPASHSAELPSAAEVALRQWFIHGTLDCLACNYNLCGLVGPVVICPECGNHNDLSDPAPWRKIVLPLGVQTPEHWPAAAVGFAVLILFGAGLSVLFFLTGAGSLLVISGFGGITFVMIGIWLMLCSRWVRSCNSKRWGWFVLIGLHVSTALLLPIPAVILAAMHRPPLSLGVILPGVGLLGFLWLKFLIRRGERRNAFRVDWRRWRLPLGTDEREPE